LDFIIKNKVRQLNSIDFGDVPETVTSLIIALLAVQILGRFWQEENGNEHGQDAANEVDKLQREPILVQLLVVEGPQDDGEQLHCPVATNHELLVDLRGALDRKV
jgi:uncharacterized membrane protein YqhA